MCTCLFWQGPFLLKVFIVGSCFPSAGRCLCCLWCSQIPGFYGLDFCISHLRSDWKLTPNQSEEGCGVFSVMQKAEKMCCTYVGCPCIPLPADSLARMWGSCGVPGAAELRGGCSRMELLCLSCSAGRPLLALFHWAVVLECLLFPWRITGVRDKLNEWNVMA